MMEPENLKRMAKLAIFFINKDVLFAMIIHDNKVCVSCNDVDKWLAIDEVNLEKP